MLGSVPQLRLAWHLFDSAPLRRGSAPRPRTFLEQFATILLPNSVPQGRIRWDEAIPLRQIVLIIQYLVIPAGTEQNGVRRISSAVLSTTQPPLQAFVGRAFRADGQGRDMPIATALLPDRVAALV